VEHRQRPLRAGLTVIGYESRRRPSRVRRSFRRVFGAASGLPNAMPPFWAGTGEPRPAKAPFRPRRPGPTRSLPGRPHRRRRPGRRGTPCRSARVVGGSGDPRRASEEEARGGRSGLRERVPRTPAARLATPRARERASSQGSSDHGQISSADEPTSASGTTFGPAEERSPEASRSPRGARGDARGRRKRFDPRRPRNGARSPTRKVPRGPSTRRAEASGARRGSSRRRCRAPPPRAPARSRCPHRASGGAGARPRPRPPPR
jgi:hypothetical protein